MFDLYHLVEKGVHTWKKNFMPDRLSGPWEDECSFWKFSGPGAYASEVDENKQKLNVS